MDSTVHASIIKLAISYTLLGAFIFTVVATCLSLIGIVKFVYPKQQNKLFGVLIVELIVICLGVFSNFLNLNPRSPVEPINKYTAGQVQEGVTNAASAPMVLKHSSEPFTILWVDDHPDNNAAERSTLEALGLKVETATSTEDAVRALGNRRFSAVISDMKRGDSSTAGYDLLEKVKATQASLPVVFYTSSSKPEFWPEARARGAFGETNRPAELIRLVLDAIQTGGKRSGAG